MSPRDKNGCNEYNALTRRRFLTGAGSAALTALSVPWLPKLAFAQSGSHFVAQEVMERAADYNNPNCLTGWLGRHLASVAPLRSDSVLRAIDFDLGLARTLFGGPGALPIPDPAQFGISGNPATLPTRS